MTFEGNHSNKNYKKIVSVEEEILIDSILKYPIEIEWIPRVGGHSNILKFATKDELGRFLFLRKYLISHLKSKSKRMSIIRIWN